MFRNIASRLKRKARVNPDQASFLELSSQLQNLKLDLEEKSQAIQRLSETIERLRLEGSIRAQENADAQMEALGVSIATPLSQLLTQLDMIENQGKTIPQEDVFALVKKLIKGLLAHGFEVPGSIGQNTVYNPALHAPLSGTTPIALGQPVKIRFVGVHYKSKALRKALVEPLSKDQP